MTDRLPTPIALLGLGAMGSALGTAWLKAGHPLTVWNRSPARTEPLVSAGATAAATPADAIAEHSLVVVCLLDDATVDQTLDGIDLTNKAVVNLTTSTPGQARVRAQSMRERGAHFLDGGIMAVPPMIGVPDSGAFIFYSGSRSLYDEYQTALSVVADTLYVGEDAGFASLYDVALLSAMYGMFAGAAHAFALVRNENIPLKEFGSVLNGWLTAMAPSVDSTAEQLESGDYQTGVVSNLAMQVAATAPLLKTAAEQQISPELLTPYFDLMRQRLNDGFPNEDLTGVIELLARRADKSQG